MQQIPKVNDRVEAVRFAPGAIDDNITVPPGTQGTVKAVRLDVYQISVAWDNGSTINLLTEKDEWKVLDGSEGRPPTVCGMLDVAAQFLDWGDVAINALAQSLGHEQPATGDGVQRDLRTLADWLRKHPNVDVLMQEALDGEVTP